MGGAGRPRSVLGVDLGGTHLRVARVNDEGRILASARAATDRDGGAAAVIAQIEQMAHDLRNDGTAAIGIGVPGAIEVGSGTVLNLPALPGWTAIPLAARLEQVLGLPCVLENDAKAATLGEWHAGAGRRVEHFVYVTISTGIGSAAVVDGRLVRGAGGLAGEIGHTRVTDSPVVCACGLTGCWQAVASGSALDHKAQERVAADPWSTIARHAAGTRATARHIGLAAREGDAEARDLLKAHAELLAFGLANLQHVYSPERIVIGGGVSALLDLLEVDIDRTLRSRLLPGFKPASVVRAALGEDAGVIGAAFRAIDALGQTPRHSPDGTSSEA